MDSFNFEISLRITTNLDADEVCSCLELLPEFIHRIGEQRKTPKGHLLEGFYDNSYCSFAYKPIDNEELHSMLDRIVSSLFRHMSLFHKIRESGGTTELFIGWYSAGNTGEVLSYELLHKISSLKLDLAFDVYGGD